MFYGPHISLQHSSVVEVDDCTARSCEALMFDSYGGNAVPGMCQTHFYGHNNDAEEYVQKQKWVTCCNHKQHSIPGTI